jgi:hypothetical protein
LYLVPFPRERHARCVHALRDRSPHAAGSTSGASIERRAQAGARRHRSASWLISYCSSFL